jgi:hypothetical protein
VKALGKFLELGPGDKLLVLEAWLYLGLARAALLGIPFRLIAPRLGRQLSPGDSTMTADVPAAIARRIGSAVERMVRHTPWDSTCLTQTIAGKFMLRRRGVPSRLYLGTRKDESGRLLAHSWLLVGNEILIGAGGHDTFTALSSFAEEGSQETRAEQQAP